MSASAARARYLADAVNTASPAALLVMTYDRLRLDLAQAEQALIDGDRQLASSRLLHAQDIVVHLLGCLDLTAWDGAAGLAQLYGFLRTQLVRANIRADANLVAACRRIVEPLWEAWREAALATAGQQVNGAMTA